MKSRVRLHVFFVAMRRCSLLSIVGNAHAFSFKDVDARAQQRAAAGFKPPEPVAPAAFRDLDETHYHAIHFQPKATYWQSAKTNFTLQFFHPGWRFIDPVKLNEITPDGVKEIVFSPSMFDYDGSGVNADAAKGLSFAGFRIHYPVNVAGQERRSAVLPRRELFPRARQGSGVRTFRARTRHRHRAFVRRRIPALRRILDPASETESDVADDLRPARFAARDRRLRIHAQARRRHDRARARAPAHARQSRQARHRAADQHVFLRLQPARDARRLPPGNPRFRRPVDPRRRTANGCGARW